MTSRKPRSASKLLLAGLLLAGCQTTSKPVAEEAPPRYSGAVAWYQDAIPVTYRPFEALKVRYTMNGQVSDGWKTLQMHSASAGEMHCSPYGADLFCRLSMLSSIEERDGTAESVTYKPPLAFEFLLSRTGQTRAMRLADTVKIPDDKRDLVDGFLRDVTRQLTPVYPEQGLRVGDRLRLADGLKATLADGKTYTADLTGLVLGKTSYRGRDCLVLETAGSATAGALQFPVKGYSLVDLSTGMPTHQEMLLQFRRPGSSTAAAFRAVHTIQ